MKLKLFVGLFLFLNFIVLPFPYWTFNLREGLFYPVIAPLLQFLANSFNIAYNPQFLSDGKLQYLSLSLVFVFSIIIGLLLLKSKLHKEKIIGFLYKANLLVLSFFMIKYGLDKIIGGQFDIVEGNLLHKELKDFSKDLLLWSTLQSSALFNHVTGAIELLGGLFLLNKDLRKLGILLSLLSMSFVVLLNFSFDINVKLLSLYLLAQSIYALSPYFNHLKKVLLPTAEIVFIYKEEAPHQLNKWLVSFFMIFVISEGAVQHFVNDNTPKSWAKSYVIKGDKNHFIHLHSDAFLIEEKDGDFTSRSFHILSIDASYINFRTEETYHKILKRDQNSFWIKEDDTLKLEKIDFSSSPYLQDDFHWFTEESLGVK
ncbi:hypothetical protein [Lishizhenia tianjinensis]|nr:hypothetical protein [Lishizhenia tianjinensis]